MPGFGAQISSRTFQKSTDCASGEYKCGKIVRTMSQVLSISRSALSQGLPQGRRVQTWLTNIAYSDVGEEHWHYQRNREEISSGELHRCGMRNPIRVDISTTRHLWHERYIWRSGKYGPGNLFALYLLQKYKIPLTHSRSSKYNAYQ